MSTIEKAASTATEGPQAPKHRTAMVSLVVPILNERESLPELLDTVRAIMQEVGAPYEVIFIDDGSDDTSADFLAEQSASDQYLRVIQFQKNYGKSAALSVGFQEARGDVVITMDGDLQDDPREIPRLLQKLDEG